MTKIFNQSAYDYVYNTCEAHFMPNKKLYTAHITLGYDYQNYGNSEEEAKLTLAACLSINNNVLKFIP
jgi:hypothetical protein